MPSARIAQTFTIQTTEDTIDEGTVAKLSQSPSLARRVAVDLHRASAPPSTVTTTITDDDDCPDRHHAQREPVNSLGEDDAATSVTVTATLNGSSTLPSDTVVTIGTLAGTATKDTDYTATSSLATMTIPANATTRNREHHHHTDG